MAQKENSKEFYIWEVNGNTSFQNEILTTKTIDLFLLFWVNENKSGTNMMSESAQTRQKNIKNSNWYNSAIHKIHNPPIQSLDEIQKIINNYIKKYGGEDKAAVKEIGIFSHAGYDGPITYCKSVSDPVDTKNPIQKTLEGWGKINFYWKKQNARLVFYGCNTANDARSFAKNISKLANCANVEVAGQTKSAFPSFYPDYRVTNIMRSGDVGWDMVGRNQTYMVGGEKNMGMEAMGGKVGLVIKGLEYNPSTMATMRILHRIDNLTNVQLKIYPIAKPMKFYKNENCINTSHQGVFNDHRKKNLQ